MDRAALFAALEAAEPKLRPVEVPAWGMTVYIRELTLLEADELGDLPELPADVSKSARNLAAVIVDEDGKRIFDPANLDHVRRLERQGSQTLAPLFQALNENNAATPAAIEKLGNGSTPAKS